MKSTRVNNVYKYAQEHNIKATKKSILEYIKDIELNKPFNGKKASKHFVFNYIGGWFADIGFNRNKEMGRKIDGDNWLKEFVLFVNGNSGWAKVYEIPNRNQEVVTSVVKRFIRDMGKYPVKRIITDNDGAFDDQTLPIKKIQSEIADNENEEHKNHRLFSRIDTFMSHLRSYAWHEYNVGKVNGNKAKICEQPPNKEFYIPLDTIKRFVYEWNEHVIPIVRCTRNEMMKDRNLELAYMCWALYGNQAAEKIREAIKGEVRIKSRVPYNDLGANRQERAHGERAGTYVIQRRQDGHYVGVDKDNREVHFNADEVTGLVDDEPYRTEEMDLENVQDEINRDDIYQDMVSKYEGPKIEKPQKPKNKKPEPSEEDAAQTLAYDEQMRDLERGIPPDLNPEAIYRNAKKWLEHLKKVDPAQWSDLIEEAAPRLKRVREGTTQKLAKSLNIQAATGTPFYQQDIVNQQAWNSGNLWNLRNQQIIRNGFRPNQAQNYSTGKQTKSQRRKYSRRS